MFTASGNTSIAQTTSYKLVLPFYLFAAMAFLAGAILLALSATDVASHYFHPHTLAITHIMALGWGTMIILGASHQLVPVLIEGKLYSQFLAYASFFFAAIGIPLLVYGFYVFDMGWPAKWGGRFIILAIISYLLNLAMSMARSKRENVHAVFVFTSALWLLATAVVGLMLVYNFHYPLMPADSIDYLPLHAHTGIVGWFLLLVTGVGSRLIPMFLVSKYNNPGRLWWIYGLINGGLLSFVFIFLYASNKLLFLLPLVCVATAIILFGHYCYSAWKDRIRKKVDQPMKVSLLSVLMLALPLVFLVIIILLIAVLSRENTRLVTSYGFIIFFGWITAIILGMTFKTLPFIIWNKVYHHLAGKGKTPNPKDLFSERVYKWMSLAYLGGFILFTAGLLLACPHLLQPAAALLLLTSVLYNWNVMKLMLHQAAPL